jgi:hypothetical protein
MQARVALGLTAWWVNTAHFSSVGIPANVGGWFYGLMTRRASLLTPALRLCACCARGRCRSARGSWGRTYEQIKNLPPDKREMIEALMHVYRSKS